MRDLSDLRVLLCGGRSLSDAVWSINRGFERLGCRTLHVPTRKSGTKYDPLDDIQAKLVAITREWKPDVLLWVMCKFDCPAGLIAELRASFPGLKTVFHSFDDPLQIELTDSPWALEFEYAVTCCEASLGWYEARGIRAICLYPPADRDLHGRAEAVAEEVCDFSFAATNVYPRIRLPHVLAERTELARAAAGIGTLNLYGPWDRSRSSWGGDLGAPELQAHHRGVRTWFEMPSIYASSRVNLNSHNRPDGFRYFNERTIHVLASGGFLLVDRVAGLEDVFHPGVHLDTWGSLEEAADKMAYWLPREGERQKIAEAGKQLALSAFDNVSHDFRLLNFIGLVGARTPQPAQEGLMTNEAMGEGDAVALPGPEPEPLPAATPKALLAEAIAAQSRSEWAHARYLFRLIRDTGRADDPNVLTAGKLSRIEEQFIEIRHEGRTFHLMAPVGRSPDLLVRRNSFQERETLDYLRTHLPKQKKILDIGCNIGNHSLFFYHFLESDAIYGFDPAPSAGFYYCQNVPEAKFFNIAVGEEDVEVDVIGDVLNERFSQARIVTEPIAFRADKKRLRTRSIDGFGFTDVTLLKVDVESWELPVLRGALKTIRKSHPAIVIEFLPDNREEYGRFFAEHLPEYKVACCVEAASTGRQDLVFRADLG